MNDPHPANFRDPERAYEERVLTWYRLYSGLFLGLPFEKLQQSAQLLPVFTDHCRRSLEQGIAPREILQRYFAEPAFLADLDLFDVLFLFVQLVERQIVLFDALEDAAFTQTHDLDAPGSIAHLTESISRDDRRADFGRLLERTSTRIVLTAHPTQFYPTTVQGIISDLRLALLDRDPATVERLLLQLGKTKFTNPNPPTPVEEAARVLDVLADVFFEVLPEIVGRALVTAHGRAELPERLPSEPNLQIGFWPGGDRDGNPYVTAAVTAEVARLLKQRVLGCYIESTKALSRRLTFAGAHESVLALLRRLQATERNSLVESPDRARQGAATDGFETADQLCDELKALRQLVLQQHQGLFLEQIDGLILKAHLFGLHFASIDLRQNSDVFMDTLGELERTGALDALPQNTKGTPGTDNCHVDWSLSVLEQLMDGTASLSETSVSQLSPLARDTILTLRLVPEIQRSNGVRGLHRVIVSHTNSPQEILAVLALARLSGSDLEQLQLDVVPLFETIEDLQHAMQTFERLLDCASYRRHLRRRGDRQTVMVGFSDGTKDGGYLTANLAIRQAKVELTQLGRERGVELIFFDGRGGPPARGGGNTHRFYRSRDSRVDQWHQQLTIQGQTISSNFGSRDVARHHVEQLFTANLENLLWPSSSEDPPHGYQPLLDELAKLAHRSYRELRDDPTLVELLAEQSPLLLFEHLTIASRPVARKRSTQLDLEQLRAIPFVATWSVLKLQVPGFFGLGSALESLVSRGRLSELRDLYRDSRFFRTLLDNAAMSLLKSRCEFHEHLARHERLGPLFVKIRDEASRSKRWILEISQQTQLLENDPINRRSIQTREQIITPLVVIVQAAYLSYLEHQRRGTATDATALRWLKLSLKGIAAIINATRNAA